MNTENQFNSIPSEEILRGQIQVQSWELSADDFSTEVTQYVPWYVPSTYEEKVLFLERVHEEIEPRRQLLLLKWGELEEII